MIKFLNEIEDSGRSDGGIWEGWRDRGRGREIYRKKI